MLKLLMPKLHKAVLSGTAHTSFHKLCQCKSHPVPIRTRAFNASMDSLVALNSLNVILGY